MRVKEAERGVTRTPGEPGGVCDADYVTFNQQGQYNNSRSVVCQHRFPPMYYRRSRILLLQILCRCKEMVSMFMSCGPATICGGSPATIQQYCM